MIDYFSHISSSYAESNEISRLISPDFPSKPTCVDFYYQIRGNDQCDLAIKTMHNGLLSLPFWTRYRDYGDEWNLAEIEVSSVSTDDFKIVFEGQVKENWQGYIAIDDVKAEGRPCRPSGFCTFESTPRFCTWKNIESTI